MLCVVFVWILYMVTFLSIIVVFIASSVIYIHVIVNVCVCMYIRNNCELKC